MRSGARAMLIAAGLTACGPSAQPDAPSEAATAGGYELTARGAEPFWLLRTDGGELVLEQADHAPLRGPAAAPEPAEITVIADQPRQGLKIATPMFDLVLVEEPCVEPSGAQTSHAIDLALTPAGLEALGAGAPDLLTGCARYGPGGARPDDVEAP